MTKSKMRVYPYPGRKATTTGIETEGDLAGTLVAEVIHLWGLASGGLRSSSKRSVQHDTEVYVERRVDNILNETMYKIRSVENPRDAGWVSERFVIFSDA